MIGTGFGIVGIDSGNVLGTSIGIDRFRGLDHLHRLGIGIGRGRGGIIGHHFYPYLPGGLLHQSSSLRYPKHAPRHRKKGRLHHHYPQLVFLHRYMLYHQEYVHPHRDLPYHTAAARLLLNIVGVAGIIPFRRILEEECILGPDPHHAHVLAHHHVDIMIETDVEPALHPPHPVDHTPLDILHPSSSQLGRYLNLDYPQTPRLAQYDRSERLRPVDQGANVPHLQVLEVM
jgi:hypothetical protein